MYPMEILRQFSLSVFIVSSGMLGVLAAIAVLHDGNYADKFILRFSIGFLAFSIVPGYMLQAILIGRSLYHSNVDPYYTPIQLSFLSQICSFLIGWRLWLVSGDVLLSLVFDCEWPARKPLRATKAFAPSLPRDFWAHRPIGIYAFENRQRAEVMLWRHALFDARDCVVLGTVAVWGEVREHVLGYRAEYAYPLSLEPRSATDRETQAAAERYGCSLLSPLGIR